MRILSLEQLEQYSIGAFDHYIFDAAKIRYRFSERDASRIQVRDERSEVVRPYPEVMNRATSGIPRWLVIEVDAAGANSKKRVAGTSHYLVKDKFSAKHLSIEPNTLVQISREQVSMM